MQLLSSILWCCSLSSNRSFSLRADGGGLEQLLSGGQVEVALEDTNLHLIQDLAPLHSFPERFASSTTWKMCRPLQRRAQICKARTLVGMAVHYGNLCYGQQTWVGILTSYSGSATSKTSLPPIFRQEILRHRNRTSNISTPPNSIFGENELDTPLDRFFNSRYHGEMPRRLKQPVKKEMEKRRHRLMYF
ncbi:unnamed protein product [Nesidiocoris tenuis]|uniref:Uncharacterized protein n=1 Tax=Nesidiocoris tenuis TaxID=355587 RepID=A0A6H5GX12_9HEMI|nr:unnamed protein product [Nesidiocoris tenuis]